MRLLMKFGGTSVGDGERMKNVVDILAPYHEEGHELGVVVSAMSGVTNQLIEMANEVVTCREKPAIEPFITQLRDRHRKALEVAAPDYVDETGRILDGRLSDLRNMFVGLNNLRELTPRSRDYLLSFGARLSAPAPRAALRQRGIPSVVLDGCEAGLTTTATHGDGIVLPESEIRLYASGFAGMMAMMRITGRDKAEIWGVERPLAGGMSPAHDFFTARRIHRIGDRISASPHLPGVERKGFLMEEGFA